MPAILLLLFLFGMTLNFEFLGKVSEETEAMADLYKLKTSKSAKTLAGIDVLVAENFALLAGMRVALVTNQSARDLEGERTIDLLANAPGVHLVSIFTPEHGLGADREGEIESARDTQTGLPVYSLYGAFRRPQDAMLTGIDAIAVDLQDVGARFYTYSTSMAYVMEEAARRQLRVIVLDRPNPIGPAGVRGPMLEPGLHSFVGYFSMPVQHGMTLGELARMFNEENHIGANLTVVQMRGYQRNMWFDEAGFVWRNPSPNLRTLSQAILYPGVALVEGTNVSVGRGTATPFQLVGAPWVDSTALVDYLQNRQIPGVTFSKAEFVPTGDKFGQESCHGVLIELIDREIFDAPLLGIELGSALYRLFPRQFSVNAMLGLVGSHAVMAAIQAGENPLAIASSWQSSLREFEVMRAKYLLY